MEDLEAFSAALVQYEQALKPVETQAKPRTAIQLQVPPTPTSASPVEPQNRQDAILALLRSRDAVQATLETLKEQQTALPPDAADPLKQLIALDQRLHKLEDYLGKEKSIKEWRKTLEPAEAAWWWRPLHPSDRWDWLWSALTVVALTGNLALVTDIAPRFLTGGPSLVGSLGAIVPAVLTLLGGSSLTEAGQRLLEKGLERLDWEEHWWQEIKCGFSWSVLILLWGFKSHLPALAGWYTIQGRIAWEDRNLASAQEYLERALALEEDKPEAQFYLGRVYENFQQKEQAIVEYQKAWAGGYLPATNNLAVLYMEEAETPLLGLNDQNQVIVEPTDYETAIAILKMAMADRTFPEQSPDFQYALYKNLGQIRLNQKRYPDAEALLQQAIQLQQDYPKKIDRGAAHCLWAELQEEQSRPALPAWEKCLSLINTQEPKADYWSYEAGIRLKPPQVSPNSQQP